MSDSDSDHQINHSDKNESLSGSEDDGESDVPQVFLNHYKTFELFEGKDMRIFLWLKIWLTNSFQGALRKWETESFQLFVFRRTIKIKEEYKDTLQYKYAYYKCVQSGKYRSDATGKRKLTHTRKHGCEAGFRVKARIQGLFLEIDSINLKHNH